jgi:AcrR family transcriptional regulator
MDKRKKANELVKSKMIHALLNLLKEKSASSISITELIKKAGVARATFYRNYNTIEDIVYEVIDIMQQDYESSKPLEVEDFHSYDFMLHLFQFYEKYADFVLTASKANISVNMLNEITDYIIRINGDMKSNSIRKYELYYYSGACYSIMLRWLEGGMKESPEEMAKEFCRISCNTQN